MTELERKRREEIEARMHWAASVTRSLDLIGWTSESRDEAKALLTVAMFQQLEKVVG